MWSGSTSSIWEIRGTQHPLVPMRLFQHKDFAISTAAIAAAGFVVSAFPVPLLYYFQLARGYSATGSALFNVPMAVLSCVLSPLVGRKVLPFLGARITATFGMILWALGLLWLIVIETPDQKLVPLGLFPFALIGVANAFIWSPISVVATRELSSDEAGAGTSIYNMTRQVGSVIGAAAISTFMTSRITANLTNAVAALPQQIRASIHISDNTDPSQWLTTATTVEKAWFTQHFAPAMAQSLWLPVVIALCGAALTLFYTKKNSDG